MPVPFEDFKPEDIKVSAADIKSAIDHLNEGTTRKSVLRKFSTSKCPTSTSSRIDQAKAWLLWHEVVPTNMHFLYSIPPHGHEKHSDYATYGTSISKLDRTGQLITTLVELYKEVCGVWKCEINMHGLDHEHFAHITALVEQHIMYDHVRAMQDYNAMLNTSNKIFCWIDGNLDGTPYDRCIGFINRLSFAKQLYSLCAMRPTREGTFPYQNAEKDWGEFTKSLKYPQFVIDDKAFHDSLTQSISQAAIVTCISLWLEKHRKMLQNASS